MLWRSLLIRVLVNFAAIFLTVLFMLTIAIWCRRNPGLSSRHEAVPMKARLASLKGLIGIVAVFALVMGGLMGGVFTPQEAGAVGTVAISPTLLAPNGPSSPSCSTSSTWTSGMSGALTMW